MIVASLMIFIFEAVGGMRSVAYTDAVQATFMIIVFITMPIILGVLFGGYNGQTTNVEDFHCNNSNNNSTGVLSGCLNYATNPVRGKTFISEQYFLRKPSRIASMNFVLFALSWMSFSLNPHVMQRAFTAENDYSVKLVLICIAFTPIFWYHFLIYIILHTHNQQYNI